MGAALEQVLQPLLRDLALTGGLESRVDRNACWAEFSRDSAMLYGVDGAGMGVAVTIDAGEQQQLVELADQVQERAVEALWRQLRPATWLGCPHHPGTHPLSAVLRAGRSVWVCGREDLLVAAVGELAPTER